MKNRRSYRETGLPAQARFACGLMVAAFILCLSVTPPVMAQTCIPGLPCTDYNVEDNPDAGTDPSLNGPKTGLAAPYTRGMCDGNLMNQMVARSFLHAERDVLLADAMIRKPDSVLEYSCFDQFLAYTGKYAPTFSETTEWESRTVDRDTDAEPDSNTVSFGFTVPEGHLTELLELFLLPPLQEYVDGQFSHTFSGGATTLDHTLEFSALGDPNYDCALMQTLWNITKCVDFGEEDQFWSFQDLVNIDPRILPNEPNPPYASCSPGYEPTGPIPAETADAFGIKQLDPCPPDNATSPPNHDITESISRVSTNCEFLYVIFDWLDFYFELFRAPGDYPGSAHPTVECRPPLPTGVTVTTYEYTRVAGPHGLQVIDKTSETHPDAVCINPGCYYDKDANECVEP